MMRKSIVAAGLAAMVLTACGKSGPPPKRQPGSWTQKVEIKRMEGKGTAEARAGLEKMFAMMSTMSVCVTPEMAAKEDPTANVEKLGGANGNCTFHRKSIVGDSLDIAGTCKDASGKTAKIAATGTLGASDQDMDLTVEGFDAGGVREGLMEMRVHSVRNGECTAKDMKAPAATM